MTDADEPTTLIAELRARVEAATSQMDELTTELTHRRAAHDELESLVDVLLGVGDTPVVVVDDERRVRALSRAATERWEGAAVGKPLSSVVPDDLYDRLVAQLDARGGGSGAGDTLVHPLPGGGAVLVLVAG
jgi:hypothetical protein